MTSYLIDTSVLIALSRRRREDVKQQLIALAQSGAMLYVCEPVAMEYLAGVSAGQVLLHQRYLDSFASLPVDPNRDFRAAGLLYAALRQQGYMVRGMIDCLIAVIAMSSEDDVVLLHDDRDFEAIASVTDLRQERLAVA